MRRVYLATSLAMLFGTAEAEIIASCGESQGHVYFVEGGGVTDKDSGFTTDRVGSELVLLSDGDSLDMLYGGLDKKMQSASADGATVALLGADTDNIHVLVVWPGANAETYLFRPKTEEVVWTQSRMNPLISKAMVMRASCSFPNG